MYRYVLALSLIVGPAFAQQPAAPIAAPVEFVLKVTPPELDIIGKGVGKLPFEEAAPLIQKLRQQVVEQQQVGIPKKVEEEKK